VTRAWWTVVVLEAVAVASAWLFSRTRREHRPVAWTLSLGLLCDVVGRVLIDHAFTVAGPYTGPRRLAFHLSQVAFTAYPAALTALALSIGTRRRGPARAAFSVWALFLAACVGGYPWLRGADRLGLAYTGAQLVAVVAMGAAARSAWKARLALGTTHAVVFCLMLAELTNLLSPFLLSALFGEWHYAQITYASVFALASAIQLEALWTTRRCTPSSV
jgi:hypothetical protein